MDDLLLLNQQLSEEEKLMQEAVAQFVEDKIQPIIAEAFEQGDFPFELISKIAELGVLGLTLPAEYGGLGASYVAYGLVCQELEKGDSGLRSFVSVQNFLCIYPIYTYGSQTQKNHWLPLMTSGKAIGCFGLTEPDSGSDPSALRTVAKKVTDGWLLNGTKTWITNASIADIAIIWANTEQGIRGFLVEKQTPGFSQKAIKHKMSLRASTTGELILKEVLVPETNLLPETQGLKSALSCLNQARFGIAWGVTGAAMACFDTATQYLLERQQFNKPLASFQLIQKDLAEIYTEIVKSQWLNLQVGRLKEQQSDNPIMISLIKGNACREALSVARKCRNLLGANGISLEYPIIRHMLNLEAVYTYEGTDNVHNLVLGRHITGINAFK